MLAYGASLRSRSNDQVMDDVNGSGKQGKKRVPERASIMLPRSGQIQKHRLRYFFGYAKIASSTSTLVFTSLNVMTWKTWPSITTFIANGIIIPSTSR